MFEELYDQNIAVGHSNVRNDSIDFRWRKKTWSFPARFVIPEIAIYNGYFYEAKIADLKRLEKKHGKRTAK